MLLLLLLLLGFFAKEFAKEAANRGLFLGFSWLSLLLLPK
jgi:hypothetical protein